MLMGAGLPKDGDIEGFKKDEFWRVIYIFPIIFCILQLLVFLLFIRVDSIVYSIKKGWTEDAKYLIAKVYKSPSGSNSNGATSDPNYDVDDPGCSSVVFVEHCLPQRNHLLLPFLILFHINISANFFKNFILCFNWWDW